MSKYLKMTKLIVLELIFMGMLTNFQQKWSSRLALVIHLEIVVVICVEVNIFPNKIVWLHTFWLALLILLLCAYVLTYFGILFSV